MYCDRNKRPLSGPDKHTETQMRMELIKSSTIRNIRRKNLETMIERQIEAQQDQRLRANQAELNTAMLALKTLTLSIVLRLAGTMFQSLLSMASCVTYVVSTYYTDDDEQYVKNELWVEMTSSTCWK